MDIKILRENSTYVAYTVWGDWVRRGYSSDVVYYVSGNYIKTPGGAVAYTIEGNRIYRGHTTEIAYTIEGDRVFLKNGTYVAYTIQRESGYNKDESARETVREEPRKEPRKEYREERGSKIGGIIKWILILVWWWFVLGFFAPSIFIAPIEKLFS